MTSFDGLCRESQIQSLIRLGQSVLLHYGISNPEITFHSYSENIVLRVNSKASAGGYHTLALRIYNPVLAKSQIEAANKWMQDLVRHARVIAPEPIPTLSGQFIVKETMPGTTEQRLCGLFQWLEGKHLDETLNASHLRQVGKMTARMHEFSALQGTAPASGLPEIDWETKFTPLLNQGKGLTPNWNDHQGAFFSKKETEIISRTARRVLSSIGSFDHRREYGMIHGDLHQWNYMFHNGSVRILDFDDTCLGNFTYDMAVTLWYLDHFSAGRVGRKKTGAYLDGYREIRDLPHRFNDRVKTYKIARHLQMVCWVLGWPRSDHIIPAQPFLTRAVKVFIAHLGGSGKNTI